MNSKRFAVLVGSETEEQVKAFLAYLQRHRAAFWHWTANGWLLVDPEGTLTTDVLRDACLDIFSSEICLVLEIRGSTGWSAFGPTDPETGLGKWLKETWDATDPKFNPHVRTYT